MPYKIIKSEDGYCVVKESNGSKKYGCYKTQDEAEEQIIMLNVSDKSTKSIELTENLTFNEIDGIIQIEGYLFRYSNPNNPQKDLHNQYWTKDTYLMTETFPIKGIPIMYGHSLKNDFTKIGIGVVNYVKEDDIGLFIKGELNDRAKWVKIVEEINKRRGYNLNRKQIEEIANKGYENIKSVVSEVPLQWSMGSYPPTYLADKKTGKIERAGIVEATLTPIPAEPDGTEAFVSFKSFVNFISLKEFDTKEVGEDELEFIKNYIKTLDRNKEINKKMADKKMPSLTKEDKMKKAFGNFAKEMVDIMAEEAEKVMGEPVEEDDAEEMKSFILKEIEDKVTKDTGFKNLKDEDTETSIKSVVAQIINENSDDIIGKSVSHYIINKQEQKEQYRKNFSGAFSNFKKDKDKENPKSNGTGGYQQSPDETKKQTWIDPTSIKNYDTDLGDFFRKVANRENPHLDYTKSMKAQNPYVGTLGGVLVGQETATTILDPLRPEVVTFGMGLTETRVNNVGIYTRPKMTTVPSAYRPGINTQISETEAKYDTITAMLRPLAARVVIPRQMLMTTGTNMESQLRAEIIRSLRLQIDKEVLEGVGVVTGSNTGQEIKGIKRVIAQSGVSSTHNVNLGGGNGAKPKYEDLINAETQIATANVELDQNTSGWIMHPRDRGTFRRTFGTDGQPLLYPNFSNKPYEDLIGYRVATTTQITNTQTVGTSTDCSDIYFGNWRYGEYVIGNDIEVILDDMTLADQLQVRFIVYLYSDFIVHYPEAFYIMSGVRA